MNKIHHETENRSLINRICPIEELKHDRLQSKSLKPNEEPRIG